MKARTSGTQECYNPTSTVLDKWKAIEPKEDIPKGQTVPLVFLKKYFSFTEAR
jgi:hypothetical protein